MEPIKETPIIEKIKEVFGYKKFNLDLAFNYLKDINRFVLFEAIKEYVEDGIIEKEGRFYNINVTKK